MAQILRWKIQSMAAILLIVVIAVGVVAMGFALKLAHSESEREELALQNQFSVVISGREAAVREWLESQQKTLNSLSENPTLRIYLASIVGDNVAEEKQVYGTYLGTMLRDRASQSGFAAPVVPADFQVRASVKRPRIAGLALTNGEGEAVVTTPGMPSVARAVAAYLEAGAPQGALISGPYAGETGVPTIAVISPIYGVQEDAGGSVLGFAIGVRPLEDDFYARLNQPGEIFSTAQNYLVRKKDGVMEYLSPLGLPGGAGKFPFVLDENTPSLAGRFAHDQKGAFGEKINYAGQAVMAMGRAVTDMDWVLVRTVGKREALGSALSRRRNIIWISALVILSVSIFIILVWRHGVSVRLSESVARQRLIAGRYEKLSNFMRIVTDSQPTSIAAVDGQGKYNFANARAAREAGMSVEDMTGKDMSAVLGAGAAHDGEKYCEQVRRTQESISVLNRREEDGRSFKVDYLPLNVGPEQGVLMVVEDLTELVREREGRETALKNLVSTLTMVIDSRDPFSANHSRRVAEVSATLAQEMELDGPEASAAEIAGALMNLGKILVPRELLTRPGNLTSEELLTIRMSVLKSAELLEGIEFEGPVVETLRQIQAHWDGSGSPEGLSGEDILISARVVAVANAFVGMVSARAHRDGMALDQAAQLLLNEADSIYDRRPVAALMNYLENRQGLERWQDFGAYIDDEGDEEIKD